MAGSKLVCPGKDEPGNLFYKLAQARKWYLLLNLIYIGFVFLLLSYTTRQNSI
jgi:hypothetical protein